MMHFVNAIDNQVGRPLLQVPVPIGHGHIPPKTSLPVFCRASVFEGVFRGSAAKTTPGRTLRYCGTVARPCECCGDWSWRQKS